MKKNSLSLFVFIAILTIIPSLSHATATGNINLLLGRKSIDSQWNAGGNPAPELTEQGEVGLLLDFRPEPWPVNIAVDFLGAESDDQGYTIKTSEVDFGFRKYFGDSASGTPYFGGGIAHIRARETFPATPSQEDDNGGLWVNGGVMFNPAPHINLGLDVRYSNALVRMGSRSIKAGGLHTGLVLGYKF